MLALSRQIMNGRYYITSGGRVFNRFDKEMKPVIYRGRKRVSLLYAKKRRTFRMVDRLVLAAFKPTAEDDMIPEHINGDTLDDSLHNLQWQKRIRGRANEANHFTIIDTKDVAVMRREYRKWVLEKAQHHQVTPRHIRDIINQRVRMHP